MSRYERYSILRIPRDLRAKMRLYSDRVDWSEEVRRFIERRVRELERERALEELEELIRRLPEAPRGTAASYVREDRDRD